MRILFKRLPFLLIVLILITGCSSPGSQPLSDEEILEKVAPYLDQLVYQDPENYDSMNDFLMANLGLDDTTVESATLYMGAPNQNTGYFLMLTPVKDADTKRIETSLDARGEAMAKTAQMGYTQGYAGYSIIQAQGRFFLVMQEDADRYRELVQLVSEL